MASTQIDTTPAAETSHQDQSKSQATELTVNDMAPSTASGMSDLRPSSVAMAEGQDPRVVQDETALRAPLPTYQQSMASSRTTISSDVGDTQPQPQPQPLANRAGMSFEPASRMQQLDTTTTTTDLHLRGGCDGAEECIPCVCCICFCLADILSMT